MKAGKAARGEPDAKKVCHPLRAKATSSKVVEYIKGLLAVYGCNGDDGLPIYPDMEDLKTIDSLTEGYLGSAYEVGFNTCTDVLFRVYMHCTVQGLQVLHGCTVQDLQMLH
jgi:hypothetical protein